MITSLIILLVAFQLKHFIADYPLQTKYMLGKFKDKDWEIPLAAHALVHGVMTFLISFYFIKWDDAIVMAGCDFVAHFCMDRVKASKSLLGRFKSLTAETAPTATKEQWRSNDFFWWSIGLDQGVHHLTHYAIIIWILLHQK